MWASVAMAVLVVILVYWVFSLLGPFGYGINFHFGDSCLHISMVLLVQSTSVSEVYRID